MSRDTLPARRHSLNFTVKFQGETYQVSVGFYPDGRPGEVFINRVMGKASAKVGRLLDDVCRDAAILISMALQHGVKLSTISHAVTRDGEGEPMTIVGAIVDHLTGFDKPGEDGLPVAPPNAPVRPAGALETITDA